MTRIRRPLLEPFHRRGDLEIHRGDLRELVPSLGRFDAVVTDPPYGISFMGAGWDHGVPGAEFWEVVLAALRPGAHLLAFGGTRKFHRLFCAIEDAGFELRDCVSWLYGTGFPKSLDVAKAIDKKLGAEDGKRWEGWGTALKPAWEPVVLARRPLDGTVAENVLRYGTGGINVDECRVETEDNLCGGAYVQDKKKVCKVYGKLDYSCGEYVQPIGRWPANVTHDGSADVVDLLPGGSDRFFYCAKVSRSERGEGNDHPTVKPIALMRWLVRLVTPTGGVVLDPFAGSASTLLAAREEGFRAVGVELEPRYCAIAARRIGGPRRRRVAVLA